MIRAPKPRNPVARALNAKRGSVIPDKRSPDKRAEGGEDDGLSVVFVVAVAKNGVIGAEGGLPWHISSDLKRFKALTMGKPVVMGRKTWESIGRPLPGRDNIVVTRDAGYEARGAEVATSVEDALAIAAQRAHARGAGEIAVIGGAEIYAQSMAYADVIELTEIDAAPAGDARFPEIDPALWAETAREAGERGPRDDHDFSYVTLVRR